MNYTTMINNRMKNTPDSVIKQVKSESNSSLFKSEWFIEYKNRIIIATKSQKTNMDWIIKENNKVILKGFSGNIKDIKLALIHNSI